MEIKHEHIQCVLLAWAAEVGQAHAAEAITAEYTRQAAPRCRWWLATRNNQQNIFHRWLDGSTPQRRAKIRELLPAILAVLPRSIRHRLSIYDTIERRALLAARTRWARLLMPMMTRWKRYFRKSCSTPLLIHRSFTNPEATMRISRDISASDLISRMKNAMVNVVPGAPVEQRTDMIRHEIPRRTRAHSDSFALLAVSRGLSARRLQRRKRTEPPGVRS